MSHAEDAFGTLLDAHAIRFERDLPGPIERVWSYLTESDLKATWIGGGEIPREVGGEYVIRWDGGEIVFRTRVYEPPHVLEYSWIQLGTPDGEIRDSYVRFELAARGDRVHLTLTHRALPSTAIASVGGGWHAHLDVLAATLAGEDGEDADTRYAAVMPQYERLAEEAAAMPPP